MIDQNIRTTIRYLIEGLAVAVAVFIVGNRNMNEIVGISLVSSVTLFIIDHFTTETTSHGTRFGVGFGIGRSIGLFEEDFESQSPSLSDHDVACDDDDTALGIRTIHRCTQRAEEVIREAHSNWVNCLNQKDLPSCSAANRQYLKAGRIFVNASKKVPDIGGESRDCLEYLGSSSTLTPSTPSPSTLSPSTPMPATISMPTAIPTPSPP